MTIKLLEHVVQVIWPVNLDSVTLRGSAITTEEKELRATMTMIAAMKNVMIRITVSLCHLRVPAAGPAAVPLAAPLASPLASPPASPPARPLASPPARSLMGFSVTKMRNVNQKNATEMRTNAIQGASKQGTSAYLIPNVPMAGAAYYSAGNWWKNMVIVMSILIVLRVHSKFFLSQMFV